MTARPAFLAQALSPASAAPAAARPMRSFWMAGFEGSDHVNAHGMPLDMVAVTGHADDLDGDYRRLARLGIRSVRESLGWRLCEPLGRGRFDFSRALEMAGAAERHGVQILWTFMHYGVPPDVSLLDDALCERFAEFASAAARAVGGAGVEAPVCTPINEISFLAWATCESNLIHPHIGDRADPGWRPLPDGFEVKQRLVRACLLGIEAIRREQPQTRFLHIDPLVHVVPPVGADAETIAEARRFREYQWQTWDMLAGRLAPELGGSAEALDLVGVNHYPTAQWEFCTGETLAWQPDDPRRLGFADLLTEAWARYGRPIVVAETGHVGEQRAPWLASMADEVARARAAGVAVEGVCLYPVIDRPDWNDPADWHRCGLWDASAHPGQAPLPAPGRHVDDALLATLTHCVRSAGASSGAPFTHTPMP